MFQSRTRFWEEDGVGPNRYYAEPSLSQSWPMAEEIPTARGLTVGTAEPSVDAQTALATFRKHYPGKSENIEHAVVIDWSRDPWASACERIGYKIGQLRKFWPVVMQPHGRIYFAGAYVDNLGWGMEAATRSANRVAEAIDKT